MNKTDLIILSAIIFIACDPGGNIQRQLAYPETRKTDHVDEYFGIQVEDPYRWLEDDNSDETAQWVKAQNGVTNQYLDQIDFRSDIEQRMAELWNYEKYTAPFREGKYYYYYKNDGLQNQYVLYQTGDPGEAGKAFLDPNTFSDDGTVALSDITFSKDGNYAAYSISVSGSDWREIYVINTETREQLPDKVEWAKFTTMTWHGDGFYYQKFDKPGEGDELKGAITSGRLFYHTLGQDQMEDDLIYENPDNPNNRFGSWVSSDERYLIVYSAESTSGNELFIKDLSDPSAGFVPVITGFDNEHQVIYTSGTKIYIETNLNAPNNRLIVTDISNPAAKNWLDVIPETENLLSVSTGGGKFFASYLKDAKTVITKYDLSGTNEGEISLPDIGTVQSFGAEWDDSTIYYEFTSFTVPPTIYSYSVKNDESTLYRRPSLEFPFDDYVTSQVFYESSDGTRIPMFIVHRKGLDLNGKNPTWLYSYGGFDVSLKPTFSVSRLVWLENGGIYAQPNIRGGGEYGEDWHKAGTKLQKKNVFEDFIAAGQFLIDNGYTSSDYLTLEGGSNGGLLVGATINMRPDLARVAIPRVGVMDMLRYQYFTIGRAWSADYGTSQDSKEMFDYLYSYSPLHNIDPQAEYPATMVMTADHDDRVVPAHSFKYAATLQEKYGGNSPVLIRIETSAGHGAGTPTSKQIAQRSDMYAFAWYNMGIIPEVARTNM